MFSKRGGIRFVDPPDIIVASGGLCEPIDQRYVLPNANERPVRDALTTAMDEWMYRARLPKDELPAFDLTNRGYHESGRPDIAARVAETGGRDEDEDERFYEHEWDEPVRLHFAR